MFWRSARWSLVFLMCGLSVGAADELPQGADQPAAATESARDADATATDAGTPESAAAEPEVVWPLMVLGIGVVIVLGLIIVGKVNAFLALITAAIVVSLLSRRFAWRENFPRGRGLWRGGGEDRNRHCAGCCHRQVHAR